MVILLQAHRVVHQSFYPIPHYTWDLRTIELIPLYIWRDYAVYIPHHVRSICYTVILAVSELMFHIMLILGLAVDPGVETIKGTCHGLESNPVPCRLQKQPYGVHYVTDEKVVYKFRPVWWGVYNMSINGKFYRSAHCKPTDSNLVCTNTFTFISNP